MTQRKPKQTDLSTPHSVPGEKELVVGAVVAMGDRTPQLHPSHIAGPVSGKKGGNGKKEN